MRKKTDKRSQLLGWVSSAALSIPVLAIAGAANAHAQQAGDAEVGAEDGAGAGVTSASPSVEVIIVSAEKRLEDLQDVPIAVTSVSGEQLAAQGVSSTQALTAVVPGLVFGHTSSSSSTYLRGVGQSVGTVGGEAAISTYLDGTYLSAPALGLFDFTNVQQVSVLRGPQGTLFGRNSTGGLIQVTTKDPSFSAPEGVFELGYGNLGTVRGSAYVGGPLASSLAGSLSFVGHESSEGYITNTETGNELGDETSYAAQGKLLWEIGANTTATLNVFATRYSGTDGIVAAVYPGTLGNDGVTIGTKERVINGRIDPSQRSSSRISSLKIEHDFGWGVLSNQTSYSDYDSFYHFNQNGTAGLPNPNNAPVSIFDNTSKIYNTANELQIQSPDNQDFKWILGTFLFQDVTTIDLDILSDESFLLALQTRVETESAAVFAQATKSVLPGTRITAGIRYTKDSHEFSGIDSLGRTPETFNSATDASYSRPTWRLAIDQDIAPNILAYASYNRGFKSGNFNNASFTAPPFGPEIVDAYEVGLKTELFDNRLRFNNSIFYYDYGGIQLKAILPPSGVAFTYNAADSEIYGLDTDFEVAATNELSIKGGFELLSAKYTTLPTGVGFVPNPVTSIPENCSGSTNNNVGGATLLTCDLSGNDLVRAPRFSANLGFEYTKQMSWGSLVFNLADAYSDKYYLEPDNFMKQPSYHSVSASLLFEPSDGRYGIKIWGTNLTDSTVYASGQTGANFTYFIGKPRSYGITLQTRY